ncbi:MAG TPA: 4-aminobutyrate--2-oxoglutarate transaminase [Alphaproteobacteria bacterium]|nr:4-aminobutyrate--2-oxoglutarate transaminase [Alphaproteobacteria bacterium]
MNALGSQTDELAVARASQVARGLLTAHPIFIERAEGARVWDVDGNRYLDFAAGIGVLNVGHNHPHIVAAVKRQLEAVSHMCFQVAGYEPYVALAARLNRIIGRGEDYRSVFLTTGAEAIENAVKIARAYTNRPGVIAFRGGFHGRTLLGVTLTGFAQPYRQNFGPFAPEIYHAPFPDTYRGWTAASSLAALDELFATEIAPDRVAAVIIEPVQGDGGFNPAPADFMQALRDLTSRHGIVLIVDEIQTGFGRTGKMFGFDHFNIRPDLVTIAKSLAGGLPLSAVVGRVDIMNAPAPGGLGGTYGGNALACAAAGAVLDLFEGGELVAQAVRRGEQLRDGLVELQRKYSAIGDVRGLGFMLAAEFVVDRWTKMPDPQFADAVMSNARERGLLVIKCGVHRNIVRFLGPLVATERDVAEALRIFDAAIASSVTSRKPGSGNVAE